MAKIYPFWTKKIQNFEFSQRYHYSYILEDTKENILGSLPPKIMTKFEVMLQKLQKCKKNWPYGARRQTYKLTEDTDFEFSYEYE